MARLTGKAALISGAASGIGAAAACALAGEGARVVLADIDLAAGEAAIKQHRAGDESAFMAGAELVIDDGVTAQ